MTLSYLQNRQIELTSLMVDSSIFGILRAKKDPSAELVETTYYELHSEFNSNRIMIKEILDSQKESHALTEIPMKKELREITSLTYIKAQKKFSRDFDKYFKR